MRKLNTFLVCAMVSLAGCKEGVPVQTVGWYREHVRERLTMLEKCKANPGELAPSANCINAAKAANQIALDQRGYEQRKPMNFSGGK